MRKSNNKNLLCPKTTVIQAAISLLFDTDLNITLPPLRYDKAKARQPKKGPLCVFFSAFWPFSLPMHTQKRERDKKAHIYTGEKELPGAFNAEKSGRIGFLLQR